MASTSKADVEKAVAEGTEQDSAKDKTLVGDEKAVQAARSAELEAQLKQAIQERNEAQQKLREAAQARGSGAAVGRERRSVKNPGTKVRSFDEEGNRVESAEDDS